MSARRLRVHALIDTLSIGGAEVLLAEYAAVAAASGVDLTVGYLKATPGDVAGERLRAAGIEPELVGIPARLGPVAFARVRRHLRSVQPQIVHTHLGYADLLGAPAGRSLGIPVVSTVHSHAWELHGAEGVKTRLMALARRRCARRIVAVSDSARAAYLAAGWDVPGRVVTVRNGIAGRALPGSGRALRDELGLAPGDLVVAMISSLRPEKAHDVAIAAIAPLRERIPNARLLIAGDGPLRDEIAARAAALGDGVVLAGYRPDAMAVLAASDVLLHPSRQDALPTTLMEAMAASVPIVATAVGGIPELVTPGREAELVAAPPRPAALADALAGLLASPARRGAMGTAGRARFEAEFTAARWAERMADLYREVAPAPR